MDLVKFYSTSDMAYGYNLAKCEEMVNKYAAGEGPRDVNYLIELYNVKLHIDSGVYLKRWSQSDIERYKQVMIRLYPKVARFFKSLSEENFLETLDAVHRIYIDDFWDLFESFKLYENITPPKFRRVISKKGSHLYNILRQKNTTRHYGSIIRDHMLVSPLSAEILLNYYEVKHWTAKEKLYFPIELDDEGKEGILFQYINSDEPNLNYLRLITNIQSNKDRIILSPKTLLAAKKRAGALEEQYFPEGSGTEMITEVIFSKSQTKAIDFRCETNKVTVKYGIQWIEQNQDYPTLLNNFIYLFGFVDAQMRCTLTSRMNDMGTLERIIRMRSEKDYVVGVVFDQKHVLNLLQLHGYYGVLFGLGIRLEDVIEWFFHSYLKQEMGVEGFRLEMPSPQSSVLEKCTTIMPAMESVLKQFSLYVQDRAIDFELLDIGSEQLIYRNIPSLVPGKYAYGIGEEYSKVTFLLFSDQSRLAYNEKTKKTYENCFELISNEKLEIGDFANYRLQELNWLIEHGYLSVDDKGFITFPDIQLTAILRDLWYSEVISYWRCPAPKRLVIDRLQAKGVVELESSLFSRPEQAYINYLLNKAQFNNGPDLRNKYLHIQPLSDDEHRTNYLIFLRLFIVAIIKINDDFCIYEDVEKYVRMKKAGN